MRDSVGVEGGAGVTAGATGAGRTLHVAVVWGPGEDPLVGAAESDRGDAEAALRYYFERVGSRWDRERLYTDVVEPARASEATGLYIPERLAVGAAG